ncbi:MAG: S41 family peptidase [Elusimicrobia bacterium]|nr:S41 family peptidase [Elusimicrobiota bacterium]
MRISAAFAFYFVLSAASPAFAQRAKPRQAQPSSAAPQALPGTRSAAKAAAAPVIVQPEEVDPAVQLTPEDVQAFDEVLFKLLTRHPKPVKKKELLYKALNALSEVDRYSGFHREKEAEEYFDESKGERAGLGIVVDKPPDSAVHVRAVYTRSQAYLAGLRAGDDITEINGQAVSAWTFQQAEKALEGERGTPVVLGVRRNVSGRKIALKISVVRDHYPQPFITARMLDQSGSRVGYLHLEDFVKDSSASVESAIEGLLAQGMQALVFDLRNNPGGLLEEVVPMACLFLKKGSVVVRVEGKNAQGGDHKIAYNCGGDGAFSGLALAVLVNENSASASEIFAGAMQDHRRAQIYGWRTYGKGTVQVLEKVKSPALPGALRLTVAYFYTPSHRPVDFTGILPDVAVNVDDAAESGIGGQLKMDLTNPALDLPLPWTRVPDPVLESAAADLTD